MIFTLEAGMYSTKALMAAALFIMACSNNSGSIPAADNPEPEFNGVDELTEMHGLTESAALEIMGEPDSEEEIVLHSGETLPEFFIEVHNTYHPDDPSTEGRIIRYLHWNRQGYSEALFLHQPDGASEWTVLESVKWSDNVEF